MSDIMFPTEHSNNAFKNFVKSYLEKQSVEKFQEDISESETLYPPGQMYFIRFSDEAESFIERHKKKKMISRQIIFNYFKFWILIIFQILWKIFRSLIMWLKITWDSLLDWWISLKKWIIRIKLNWYIKKMRTLSLIVGYHQMNGLTNKTIYYFEIFFISKIIFEKYSFLLWIEKFLKYLDAYNCAVKKHLVRFL